jgi:hypothetical protein
MAAKGEKGLVVCEEFAFKPMAKEMQTEGPEFREATSPANTYTPRPRVDPIPEE